MICQNHTAADSNLARGGVKDRVILVPCKRFKTGRKVGGWSGYRGMKPLYPPPHWSPEITVAETIISILQMRRMRLKEEEAPGPGNTVSLLHGVGRGLPLCPGQHRDVRAQFGQGEGTTSVFSVLESFNLKKSEGAVSLHLQAY